MSSNWRILDGRIKMGHVARRHVFKGQYHEVKIFVVPKEIDQSFNYLIFEWIFKIIE